MKIEINNFSTPFEQKEYFSETESNQPDAEEDEVDVATETSESKPTNLDYSKSVEDIIADIESAGLSLEPPSANRTDHTAKSAREVKFDEAIGQSEQSQSYRKQFMPNKQHTGMKNISSNVGAAVAPHNKMEFDQEEESFGVVKLNRPVGRMDQPDDAVSTISSINSEGLTEQGYFDLKFYHNKLW